MSAVSGSGGNPFGTDYFVKGSKIKWPTKNDSNFTSGGMKQSELKKAIAALEKTFPALYGQFSIISTGSDLFSIEISTDIIRNAAPKQQQLQTKSPPEGFAQKVVSQARTTMEKEQKRTPEERARLQRAASERETKTASASASAQVEPKKTAAERHFQALNGIIFINSGRLQRFLESLPPGSKNGVPPKLENPIEVVQVEGDKAPFVVTIRGPEGDFKCAMSEADLNRMKILGGYSNADLDRFKSIQQTLVGKLEPKVIRNYIDQSKILERMGKAGENYNPYQDYGVTHIAMIPSSEGTAKPNYMLVLRPRSEGSLDPISQRAEPNPYDSKPVIDINPYRTPGEPLDLVDSLPVQPPPVKDINPYVVPEREYNGEISISYKSDIPTQPDVVILLSLKELEDLARFART